MSKYGQNNLTGVRVAHDFDDFLEDREVILTLKDTYLLDNQDVNRDSDVLENIDLSENFRHEVRQEGKKKTDDEYFEGKYGGEKKILPQYDEKPTEKQGIMLDSLGEYSLDRQRKIDSIKAKLSGPKKNNEINLDTAKNVASEYYTTDEMKKFKKPAKKVVNVQKNKEDILKFLEESMEDSNETGSRDTRKAREKAALDDVVTKKLKTDNYEVALQKAREQTRSSAIIDEEYEEIQRSIENQRRATQTGRNNKVEDVVRNLLETNRPVKSKEGQEIVVELNPTNKPAGDRVELDTITTSTDFLNTVTVQDGASHNKNKTNASSALSVRDTRDGTTSVVNVSLPSEKILAWNKAQTGLMSSTKPMKKETTTVQTNKDGEDSSDELYTEEELQKLNEEREFIQEDTMQGGLAAALKAAREKGYLNENETEIAGRHNDQTYRTELKKLGSSTEEGVRLEYRDKHGRMMTPKEAFRYQCRIFHGITPSKNKQEKEKKHYEAHKKRLSTAVAESASMKALNKVQQQNNQAYAILDNKSQK